MQCRYFCSTYFNGMCKYNNFGLRWSSKAYSNLSELLRDPPHPNVFAFIVGGIYQPEQFRRGVLALDCSGHSDDPRHLGSLLLLLLRALCRRIGIKPWTQSVESRMSTRHNLFSSLYHEAQNAPQLPSIQESLGENAPYA
ncbi:hypothetical protein AVEN_89789-1 [Araneus ventricosus]|uniref:Uncharacterized protein n=1 Tax=Araneus ventricosus TaxID=182803 RepID=A0A4Y2I3I1_ARAVE|nr:hypothetical protein AVEN_89789-1 [Araneus ventricosus]